MEIYLWLEDQQQGPYPIATIEQWLADGTITNETGAWADGEADWSNVGQLLAPKEAPKIKRGTGATPKPKLVANSTSANPTVSIKRPNSETSQQSGGKTVAIQGSLKRGLAKDLHQDTNQLANPSTATSSVEVHQPDAFEDPQDEANPEPPEKSNAAIIGLILPLLGLGPIGIFFSKKAMAEVGPKGLALTGLILNILSCIAWIIAIIGLILTGGAALAIFKAADDRANTSGFDSQGQLVTGNLGAVRQRIEQYARDNEGELPTQTTGLQLINDLGLEQEFYYDIDGIFNYIIRTPGNDGRFLTGDDRIRSFELSDEILDAETDDTEETN